MRLLLNLVRKDFEKNRSVTIALLIFLLLSALMMAVGLRVAGTMMAADDGLNQKAIPPDYLQMHKGAIDEAALEQFAANQEAVRAFQTVSMLDIDNGNILYNGETLESVMMDNGFVVQNQGFDYLLNMENQVAAVGDGEIGVPVYYAETLGIKVGDEIILKKEGYTKTLRVAEIIRDAQMNVAMTSSKRFLITPTDQKEISGHMGEWEYSLEFLLQEGASPASLETAYRGANLPSNGVAITGSMLELFNMLSYGLVAMMITAISLILILMALLCLSFIIGAAMADEGSQIGEMKALGFPQKAVVALYRTKYLILMSTAGIIGYLGAIPVAGFFSASVILYCGEGDQTLKEWLLPLIGLGFLSMLIFIHCHRTVKKNLNNSVVELLRGAAETKMNGHYRLPKTGRLSPNLIMALGELKCKWRQYPILFIVFVLSAFLMILPMNMKATLKNPSFMTYMGVGSSDLRMDIQYSGEVASQKEMALSLLKNDPTVSRWALYKNGYVQARNAEGSWSLLRVESGDEAVFPLQYREGQAPDADDEMALSELEAAALGKKMEDTVLISYAGTERLYRITGIYQDITYGGKTAKAMIEFREEDVDAAIIYLDLNEGVDVEKKAAALREVLPGIKITPVESYLHQTMGEMLDNLNRVEMASSGVSLLISGLMSIMFLKLVMAREHRDIAIKKAMGFTDQDIRWQLGIRMLFVLLPAVLLGTVLANSLGEKILGWLLASMGASRVTLLTEPLKALLLAPALLLLVVASTVAGGTRSVKKYHIREQINE